MTLIQQWYKSGIHGFNSTKINYLDLEPRYRETFNSEVLELFDLHGNSSAVNTSTPNTGTDTLKRLLSNKTVESFSFRTCVKPKLSKNELGETEIIYESLTAQDLHQKSEPISRVLTKSTKISFLAISSRSIRVRP